MSPGGCYVYHAFVSQLRNPRVKETQSLIRWLQANLPSLCSEGRYLSILYLTANKSALCFGDSISVFHGYLLFRYSSKYSPENSVSVTLLTTHTETWEMHREFCSTMGHRNSIHNAHVMDIQITKDLLWSSSVLVVQLFLGYITRGGIGISQNINNFKAFLACIQWRVYSNVIEFIPI